MTTFIDIKHMNQTSESHLQHNWDSLNKAALLNAKSGDTVTVYVTKGNEVGMQIQLLQTTNKPTTNTALVPSTSKTAAHTLKTAANTVVTVPSLTTPFAGATGAAFTAQNVIDYLTKANAATLYTDNYYILSGHATVSTSTADALAKSGTYTEYKLVSSRDGNYSSDSSAVGIYTATVKTGISPVHNQKTTTTPGSSFE